MEVEAYNKVYNSWWPQLFPKVNRRGNAVNTSPFYKLSNRVTYKYRDKNGNYKGRYRRKVEAYQEIKRLEAAGTELTEEQEQDKRDLEKYFENKRPKVPRNNGDYDPNMDMDCD
ncbi:MAG: hypothetical protein F4X56_09020 [Gammaproteobacteria bacterium]|nr:hypothetical protein [Gammaproteobacteria bacterium]MYC26042.1 hypothetical protein [Gammaproteobacteria bacterium]